MHTAELLARLAAALRTEIGPAVEGEYPRTQAFMAGVILERVSRELALDAQHAAAAAADGTALRADLDPVLAAGPPPVRVALDRWAEAACAIHALTPLIEALYAWGPDEPAAVDALALIRPVLRRDIDRRMEIAQ
ncbi:MAG: hypothetical protein OEV40_05440 [Acidimicrobiia bacterium]|nr:hypothetical protein [Acidimicrobiia bacterium]